MANGQTGKNPGGTAKMILAIILALAAIALIAKLTEKAQDSDKCRHQGGNFSHGTCVIQTPTPSVEKS